MWGNLTAKRITFQWRLGNFCRAVGMREKVFCSLTGFVQCPGDWAPLPCGLFLPTKCKSEIITLYEPLRTKSCRVPLVQGHHTGGQTPTPSLQKQCSWQFMINTRSSLFYKSLLPGLPGQARKALVRYFLLNSKGLWDAWNKKDGSGRRNGAPGVNWNGSLDFSRTAAVYTSRLSLSLSHPI